MNIKRFVSALPQSSCFPNILPLLSVLMLIMLTRWSRLSFFIFAMPRYQFSTPDFPQSIFPMFKLTVPVIHNYSPNHPKFDFVNLDHIICVVRMNKQNYIAFSPSCCAICRVAKVMSDIWRMSPPILLLSKP